MHIMAVGIRFVSKEECTDVLTPRLQREERAITLLGRLATSHIVLDLPQIGLLINLTVQMLQDDRQSRPNVVQVSKRSLGLGGREYMLHGKYCRPTEPRSETTENEPKSVYADASKEAQARL